MVATQLNRANATRHAREQRGACHCGMIRATPPNAARCRRLAHERIAFDQFAQFARACITRAIASGAMVRCASASASSVAACNALTVNAAL